MSEVNMQSSDRDHHDDRYNQYVAKMVAAIPPSVDPNELAKFADLLATKQRSLDQLRSIAEKHKQ
jgi:hypothetical protein